ncbi:hypothetical protein [Haladaptatus sp. DFWS20]|uniref:hypothetical protein n=1 Tax=Haladaptatus sp. DFWS20 TaxID=3403467 RepID=UPI003EB9B193
MTRRQQYSLEDVKRVLREPKLLRREIVRLQKDIALKFNAYCSQLVNRKPRMDVMEEDWDNLIILDACRYDMYIQQANFGDRVTSKLSPGSESWEFMQESFVGRECQDTVYVTANPHAFKLPDETFHAIVNLLSDDWNEKHRTVLPETMVQRTLEVLDQYPDKRIISHFMQPHFPFIGEKGKEVEHMGIETDQGGKPHPWNALLYGMNVDRRQILDAYAENLSVVLPHVFELVQGLNGKTVITADHGNLVGERTFPIPIRAYGHPRNLHKRELIQVPWVVNEATERRIVKSDSPIEYETLEEEVIKDRLSDLGYTGY